MPEAFGDLQRQYESIKGELDAAAARVLASGWYILGPEVRAFAVESAMAWLRDYRFDGLRLDAIHAIIEPGKMALLRDLSVAAGELAEATGRAKSNLSRTLKTMERYGLVRFEKGKGRTLMPRTPYTDVVLDLSLRASPTPRRSSPSPR